MYMLIKRNSSYDALWVLPSGSPLKLSTIYRAKLKCVYNSLLCTEHVRPLTIST